MKKIILAALMLIVLLLMASCTPKEKHVCTFSPEIECSDDAFYHKCECGETSEHIHEWEETVVEKATCDADGESKRECKTCGATETAVIEKYSEHKLKSYIQIKPRCESEGKERIYCEYCNYSEVKTIPPTGHTLVTRQEVAPTCIKTGRKEYQECVNCDYHTACEVIPTVDHEYENGKCISCSATEPNDYLMFSYYHDGGVGAKFLKPCPTELVVPKYSFNGELITALEPLEYFRNVEKITFANKDLKVLWKWTFKECTSLREIELPNVEALGERSFQSCDSLVSIKLPDSLQTLGEYCFLSCAKLKTVEFSENLKKISSNAFTRCPELEVVELPDGLETLGNSVFSGCTGLVKVVIPESITEMGSSVFSGCTSLTDVQLPSYMRVVPSYTFSDCTSLEQVTLPITSHHLEDGVFRGCTSLKNVTLGKDTLTIGAYSFENCSSLEKLSLPKRVHTIGDNAFVNCTNLKEIVFEGTMSDWNNISIGKGVFDNTSITKIICSDGTVNL